MTERGAGSPCLRSEQPAGFSRHQADWRKRGVEQVLEERSGIQVWMCFKLEKVIRCLNGIGKLARKIWSSGTRPGDRNLGTLKYLDHCVCARQIP